MKIHDYFIVAALSFTLVSSCVNDLDTVPLDNKVVTSGIVFDRPAAYKEFLAKLYGSFILAGQIKNGDEEISPGDLGAFLRTYFNLQELSTDEVINGWPDPGLSDFRNHIWDASNLHIQALYQRIFINIAFTNEYIREVSSRLESLSGNLKNDVVMYLAEARFLRAFYYYCAMDLYGNVPYVTEKDAPGAFLPKQITRAELFSYIETELKEIMPSLAPPKTNEYARADQAAAAIVLAKMYLNSEVYLGKGNKKYDECITYCNNIINSGKYSLHNKYNQLFLSDNHLINNEVILAIAEDGINSVSYGGVTYIINASLVVKAGQEKDFGIAGGWAGNRITRSFTSKFPDVTGEKDKRAIFTINGHTLDINNPENFEEGYLNTKFRNVSSYGVPGKNNLLVDTDFPLYRFADVYLMYAEAVLRGGSGGSMEKALEYINIIRKRAYGNDSGNITSSALTLDFILDERLRELQWEAHRRTDLIRYGYFTSGSYKWQWKGGIKDGIGTNERNNLYPLPASDLSGNTNLKQNIGY